jgi:YbbR domain-containing protein
MKDGNQQLERSLLARLLFDNYPLKLMALALSVALFSLVHSDHDAQRSIYLDVVALLPPPSSDQMLVSDLPSQIRVTVQGSRSKVAALQRDDFAPIQMDLRDPGPSRFYFDQNTIDVSGPVQVVSVEPTSIDLAWAIRASRRVLVHARLRGMPEQGHSVKKPVVISPAYVTLQGPKDEVDTVNEVYTDEIPVDGLLRGQHERRVQLQPLPPHVAYKEGPHVDVQLEVVAERGERVLRHVEVAVLGASEASVRPTSVSITLVGPVSALSDIDPEQIVPYVDLTEHVPDSAVAPAEVKLRGLPEGFALERIAPASVLAKRVR